MQSLIALMDSATADTDLGDGLKNIADDLAGDLSGQDAMMWYAIGGAICTWPLHLLMKALNNPSSNSGWYANTYKFFIPVVWAYVFYIFFEGKFMMGVVRDITVISTAAPFLFMWISIATQFVGMQNFDLMDWVEWSLQVVLTAFMAALQVVLVPVILDWAGESHSGFTAWIIA